MTETVHPFQVWHSVQHTLEKLLFGALHEHAFPDHRFEASLHHLASQVQNLVEHDADAGIAAMLLDESIKYPVAHSLHVAIVCELVMQKLQFTAAQRHSALCAAMTMNLGMVELQNRLIHQQTPLSHAQREQIGRHPQVSFDILLRAGVVNEDWLRAVLEHHETADGKGYPRGITQPSAISQVIRLADIFCAKISPRAHRKGFLPNLAVREIFTKESDAGKNPVAAALIKEIGIYPPGSCVKLANQELAIVFKRGASAQTPWAAVLTSATGLPLIEPLERDTALPEFAIETAVSRDKLAPRLRLQAVWGRQSETA